MPPHAIWFRGIDDVVGFFRSPRFSAFWARNLRVLETRANGLPAFAFYRRLEDGGFEQRALMVARFVETLAAELTVFVGPSYLSAFDIPIELGRTVSGSPLVLEDRGDHP
jgi:RNA polymerase sigma-70 factor (ECF subfamily)